MSQVVVSGRFDDLRSPGVRFLEEASRLGTLHVLLWSDELVRTQTGNRPRFPEAERRYFLEGLRYVSQVSMAERIDDLDALPDLNGQTPGTWAVCSRQASLGKQAWCRARGLCYRVISDAELRGFPVAEVADSRPGRKKVLVTGCYDWLHSGHLRFFEEAAEYGDLYVVVGQDANIRLLKGDGHPLLKEEERRYMVQAIRHVHQCLVATGLGWLDAEPEIVRLRPDIYLVNEDGDKPEKQEYCEAHGIKYLVLKREPAAGLPRRQSTDLRGF